MHINTQEFLTHINDGKNISYFRGAPKFDVDDKEEGEITIRLQNDKDSYGEAVDSAVEILQALHNVCLMVKSNNTDVETLPVTDKDNPYLYVNTEKRSVGFKDNVYMVTLPFTGAKFFAKFITYFVGQCVEIKFETTLDEENAIDTNMEEEVESEVGKSIIIPKAESESSQVLNFADKMESIRNKKFEQMTKEQMSEMEVLDDDLFVETLTRYKVKKFKTEEELVKFLNKKNIQKEDIIDIQHKWFSHVLIYAYKKEVTL